MSQELGEEHEVMGLDAPGQGLAQRRELGPQAPAASSASSSSRSGPSTPRRPPNRARAGRGCARGQVWARLAPPVQAEVRRVVWRVLEEVIRDERHR